MNCEYKKHSIRPRWMHRHSKSPSSLDLPHYGKRQRFKHKFKKLMSKFKTGHSGSNLPKQGTVCLNEVTEKIETPSEKEARLLKERTYFPTNRNSLTNYPQYSPIRNYPAPQQNVSSRPDTLNKYPLSYSPMDSFDAIGDRNKTYPKGFEYLAVRGRHVSAERTPVDSVTNEDYSVTNEDDSYVPTSTTLKEKFYSCLPGAGRLSTIFCRLQEPVFSTEAFPYYKNPPAEIKSCFKNFERRSNPKKVVFENSCTTAALYKEDEVYKTQPIELCRMKQTIMEEEVVSPAIAKKALDIVCSSAMVSANIVSNTFGTISAFTSATALATADIAGPMASVFASTVANFAINTFKAKSKVQIEKNEDVVVEDLEIKEVVVEDLKINDLDAEIPEAASTAEELDIGSHFWDPILIADICWPITTVEVLEITPTAEVLDIGSHFWDPIVIADICWPIPTVEVLEIIPTAEALDIPPIVEELDIPLEATIEVATDAKSPAPKLFGLFKKPPDYKEFKLTKVNKAEDTLCCGKLGINLAQPIYLAGNELGKDIDDFIIQCQKMMEEDVVTKTPTAPGTKKTEVVSLEIRDASTEVDVISSAAPAAQTCPAVEPSANITTQPPMGSPISTSALESEVLSEINVLSLVGEPNYLSPLTLVNGDPIISVDPEKREMESGAKVAPTVLKTVTLFFNGWMATPLGHVEH